MALENINVGNLANDGTGDDLRDAFIKINQNFQSLENLESLRGNNLGSAGAEVFASFQDGQLNFRRIVEGPNVTVTQLDNTIQISASQLNRIMEFRGNTGTVQIVNSGFLNVVGDDNLFVNANNNTQSLVMSLRGEASKYLGLDFGDTFSPTKTSILDFVISTIGVDFGTFSNPSKFDVDGGVL